MSSSSHVLGCTSQANVNIPPHPTTIEERESMADHLLDLAIDYKANNQIDDCIHAHLERMKICPIYSKIDAVRLLGVGRIEPSSSSNVNKDGWSSTGKESYSLTENENSGIQEISKEGIFDADLTCGNDDSTNITEGSRKGMSSYRFKPTHNARILGKSAREVLSFRNYTLEQCRPYLLSTIQNNKKHNHKENNERIFSGNSYFNHRLDFYLLCQDKEKMMEKIKEYSNDLSILVSLFLFGLSIEKNAVIDAIGIDDMQTLMNAALLRQNPANPSDVMAEVQIYPLSPSNFQAKPNRDIDENTTSAKTFHDKTYFFATDWPMESLRCPKFAVMPVGYDTLELLSLSAAGDIHGGRILDLCCGNGIQGLFAWVCSGGEETNTNTCGGGPTGLVCVDINERACHFVTANIALNSLDCKEIYALQGDLFEPLMRNNQRKERFSRIVSNPPFVAVPDHEIMTLNQSPSLYAAAGVDGMNVVRRIFTKCFEFLESDGNNSFPPSLLMVTEVPNVEDSCGMLQSFLPRSVQENTKIRVAFVEEDVEPMEDYIQERCEEKGVDDSLEWSTLLKSMDGINIRNRALVLLSISRWDNKDEPIHGLHNFSMSDHHTKDTKEIIMDNDNDDIVVVEHDEDIADEEDAFLTREGIAFTRACILGHKI